MRISNPLKTLPLTLLLASTLTLGVTPAAFANDATTASESPKPWSMADQYYGADAMAEARAEVQASDGGQKFLYVLFNQAEVQFNDGEENFYWNGMANWGGDINKLWLKTEGRASLNGKGVDDAEVQLLYSRAVAPFWSLQGGVRYDIEPNGLAHAAVALNGLAPYWFEVDASAFLSEKGDLTSRIEVEYDLLLNQRLILQPRIEANLSAQDIQERDTGSGLNSIDAGIRLRYEIKRELAPYIGVEWQKAFGDTANFIKASGGDADKAVLVLGLRTWF